MRFLSKSCSGISKYSATQSQYLFTVGHSHNGMLGRMPETDKYIQQLLIHLSCTPTAHLLYLYIKPSSTDPPDPPSRGQLQYVRVKSYSSLISTGFPWKWGSCCFIYKHLWVMSQSVTSYKGTYRGRTCPCLTFNLDAGDTSSFWKAHPYGYKMNKHYS